jgi:hypothetical protein
VLSVLPTFLFPQISISQLYVALSLMLVLISHMGKQVPTDVQPGIRNWKGSAPLHISGEMHVTSII